MWEAMPLPDPNVFEACRSQHFHFVFSLRKDGVARKFDFNSYACSESNKSIIIRWITDAILSSDEVEAIIGKL